MAENEWDATVKEWTVAVGTCYAAGLAGAADGAMYSVAADDDDGWSKLYKENYKIDVLDENAEVKGQEDVSEAETIRLAMDTGRVPNGVWIGGVKHKIVKYDKDVEQGDYTFDTVICARPKGGAHLIKTPGGNIVVVLYDEDKEQSKAASLTTALAFGEYLASTSF